uniref:Uncharacterized protein n=1 Tax=Gouania willdenowi TaxID=441366 RepID=A0A8C5I1V2_GOUWI
MSGRVGDLSPKQAEALEQFRARIQDVFSQLPAQNDHFLLRWLRVPNRDNEGLFVKKIVKNKTKTS